MAKKKKQRSTFEELEDASLKLVPAGFGMLFGLIGSAIAKQHSLIVFMISGAIGSVLLYALLYGFFAFFNPGRDRSKKG